MDERNYQFIKEHHSDDVHSIALQAKNHPDVDFPFVIRQITGIQKIKEKIPHFYNCTTLHYPARLSLEQSSSEKTARYKASLCEGKILIDLTGGFGVDSFFLSSHFEKVNYVEKDAELCTLARHNFKQLTANNIEVHNKKAEIFLQNCEKADWIFADPARRSKSGEKTVFLSDCEPDIKALYDSIAEKSNYLLVKLSPMIDLSSLISDLPHLIELHVVAVENECKEVLALIDFSSQNSLLVKTIHFHKDNTRETFHFQFNEEQNCKSKLTTKPLNYLYEPNAAVMKSGAYKLIGTHFNLLKLHVNSHLYTSESYIANFPGRKFEVLGMFDLNKQGIKQLSNNIPQANLSIRNFPSSVNDLRKKLKLKDGGADFLFATTLADGKKQLIHCKRLT